MTSDETQLNPALEAAGITPSKPISPISSSSSGNDQPSHIVVPALHRNRSGDPPAFSSKR